MKDLTVTVDGKRYRLMFVPMKGDTEGLCDPPDKAGKAIRVKASLKGERRLDVLIHELLHASHWKMDEEAVAQTASDIARILWRLGYREG